MKYLSLGLVLVVCAVGLAAQTPADKANDQASKAPITLTGCVEQGKEANTFILTHVVKSDSAAKSSAGAPQPSVDNPTATPPIAPPAPTATSGTDADASAAIYWLDPADKLKAHVGHKVSVSGTLDDDVDKAKVKTDDDKVKIEAERGSRKVEAKPGSAAAADAQAAKTGDKQPSYKVNVKSVTMISNSCS
jgi:hypothetical protein